MPVAVNMLKAKSSLSQLVKRAEAGEDVIIARNRKPVVRLTRLKPAKSQLPCGALHGWIADDFDAPMEEMKDYV